MATNCIWGNFQLVVDNVRYSLAGDWTVERGGTVLGYETNLDGSLQISGETMPWKLTGGQISGCDDIPEVICGASAVLEFFNVGAAAVQTDGSPVLRGYSFNNVTMVGQGVLNPKTGYWTGFEFVATGAREIRR